MPAPWRTHPRTRAPRPDTRWVCPAARYRAIFPFAVFNKVQSACVDDALYTDANLVVSGLPGLTRHAHTVHMRP
jgi:hypothetical protein